MSYKWRWRYEVTLRRISRKLTRSQSRVIHAQDALIESLRAEVEHHKYIATLTDHLRVLEVDAAVRGELARRLKLTTTLVDIHNLASRARSLEPCYSIWLKTDAAIQQLNDDLARSERERESGQVWRTPVVERVVETVSKVKP